MIDTYHPAMHFKAPPNHKKHLLLMRPNLMAGIFAVLFGAIFCCNYPAAATRRPLDRAKAGHAAIAGVEISTTSTTSESRTKATSVHSGQTRNADAVFSSVATLSNLSISSGSLSPLFDPGTNSYSAGVTNDISAVTVTPVVSDTTASVVVNGITVKSGSASGTVSLAVGSNLINVMVTAGDGVTTNTYTINVIRAASSNAGLGSLILSTGALTPGFTTATTSYTVNLPATSPSIILTPTTSDPTATLTVNGNVLASGAPSPAINLNTGVNIITVIVTAQDGVTSKTYTVKVTRGPSINASLASINPSIGPLTPTFLSGTFSYTLNVSNVTASMTVRPVTIDANATIKVNGASVTPGTSSSPIVLIEGATTLISIVVTAQDGVTKKTYTVAVTRAPSGDASLAAINLSSGTLSPTFGAGSFSYAVSLPNIVSSLNITPTVTDANATVVINGAPVASGIAAPVALAVGLNMINVTVTAQNGVTTQTYTITATRAPSSDASLANISLSNGSLSPAFDPGTNSYIANVTNDISAITVTPFVTEATAAVSINGVIVNSGSASGPVPLVVGSNSINISVIAGDGITTETYTVSINRAPSSNASLANVNLSNGTLSPVFDPATFNYIDTVGNAVDSLTVTPILADPTASLTINGIAEATGSATFALTVGTNVVTISVTAQDGTTNKTYTFIITRLPSSDAGLVSFSSSVGAFNPPFEGDITDYAASVTLVKKDHLIYTVGESITANGEYQIKLGSLLNNAFRFVNFGISGEQTTGMLAGFQATINATPDYVIIMGGVDDIRNNVSAVTVENNLQAMYTAAHNAGIKVIALTITPFKGSVKFVPGMVAVQDSVNSWIPTASNVDFVIDTYSALVDPSNSHQLLPVYDGGDHLHPSKAGEDEIASLIYATAVLTPNPLVDQANAANASVTLTPVANSAYASVMVNGQAVPAGSSGSVLLSPGLNTFTTQVTAQDGVTSKTYNLNITGAPSNIAKLADIYLTNGSLSFIPVFSPDSTSYTASVPFDTVSVKVRPTLWDATGRCTVNGVPIASGTLTNPISLNVGVNTFIIVVTAQDGITTKTYTLSLTRLPSTGPLLSDIQLSNGLVLSPAFNTGTLKYTAQAAGSVSSVQIRPVTTVPGATITVNGQAVASDSVSQVILLTLPQNVVTIIITSANGAKTETYTLTIFGTINKASLSSLKMTGASISPTFNISTTAYTANVANTTKSTSITPTAADSTSTITVNNSIVASGSASSPISLGVGSNVITVAIMGSDSVTTQTYTITVTRPPSVNAGLSRLALSAGALTPVFASATTSYSVNLNATNTTIAVTPTASDATATITVNGSPLSSGATSAAINLNTGPNIITIVVTAQDGSTSKTYSITVNRALSTNASLSSINPSITPLTPAFAPSTTVYTLNVSNVTQSITLRPVVSDPTATITINGTPIASGITYGPISLTAGAQTVISTVVTAQDGVTIRTYTLTVTRAASSDATLSSLNLSSGTLAPVFSSGTSSYTTTVPSNISTFAITPTTTNPRATVTVNGTPVASGTASGVMALNVGPNTITTTVIAQDGTTTRTYTLTVNRGASSNANLASIGPSTGSLTPVFATGTTSYALNVSSATASVTIKPVASDPTSTITVNGTAVISGSASGPIVLPAGTTMPINVLVTAQDGITKKNYSIIVTRPLSADANLSNFQPGSGALNPVFSSGITDYTVRVPDTASTMTVTPTVDDTTATVKVNGTPVVSGTASGPITLNLNTTTVITTVVTAKDGTTTKTYTITVPRGISTIAKLSAIGISSGTLSPAFASGITSYTANVPNNTATITLTPVATDINATIKINGIAVASGTPFGPLALNVGANTINLLVTAQDSVTVQTYQLIITRSLPANANLSSIGSSIGPLTPAFVPGTTSYTLNVGNTIASITVKPVSTDPNATIKVNGTPQLSGTVSGPIALADGASTIISITVTAQDGKTTKTYTLTVNRASSTVAGLSNIQLSTGTLSPVFDAGTVKYAITVPNTTTAINITPFASQANSAITVNQSAVLSGTVSGPISLSLGPNTITTLVTAQDGSSTKAYTLTVTRAPSANASLASLNPGKTPLSPAFTTGTFAYTLNVGNSISTMTIKPVTIEPNATLTVNGAPAISGVIFGPIGLSVGSNTITVKVTAQDGKTTKTYTLTVSRAAPTGNNNVYQPLMVEAPVTSPTAEFDGIMVHQGLSPNGDGVNDFLQIENISRYPDNKLTIMNRNGQMIYEAKGYDNSSKTFDGHSNKNGQLQLPGTYFYQLDYTVGGITKHKTGFIVLKY